MWKKHVAYSVIRSVMPIYVDSSEQSALRMPHKIRINLHFVKWRSIRITLKATFSTPLREVGSLIRLPKERFKSNNYSDCTRSN